MNVPGWVVLVLVLVAIGPVGYGLHRLMLWLEDRGWVYYARKKPEGSGGAFLGPLHEIYEPRVKHVYEVKRHERHQEGDEAGDRGPERWKPWFLGPLSEALAQDPVDLAAVRACLEAAARAGLNARELYREATASRSDRAPLVQQWEAVAPDETS